MPTSARKGPLLKAPTRVLGYVVNNGCETTTHVRARSFKGIHTPQSPPILAGILRSVFAPHPKRGPGEIVTEASKGLALAGNEHLRNPARYNRDALLAENVIENI